MSHKKSNYSKCLANHWWIDLLMSQLPATRITKFWWITTSAPHIMYGNLVQLPTSLQLVAKWAILSKSSPSYDYMHYNKSHKIQRNKIMEFTTNLSWNNANINVMENHNLTKRTVVENHNFTPCYFSNKYCLHKREESSLILLEEPNYLYRRRAREKVKLAYINHYKKNKKFIYYNEKNHCNNIRVIAIVYAKCCNKIWGNRFVLQKISLQ